MGTTQTVSQRRASDWIPLNSAERYDSYEGWKAGMKEQRAVQEQAITENPAMGQAATAQQMEQWWNELSARQQSVASPQGNHVPAGTSGADEYLLSHQGYAIVQAAKSEYADAQQRYNQAVATGDTTSAAVYQQAMNDAHLKAEQIRQGAGYSGGVDGSMYMTGWGDRAGADNGSGSGASSHNVGVVNWKQVLEQWKKSALEQHNNTIDQEVQRAVTALERVLADAQPQFREQVEGVARDELQALDNSALYAEARGDRGGIGRSQYNEIQAQAAENRLAVQQAQTRLATDSDRQIEDLRARGEFEKADKALTIAQSYLTQLVSMEQWAAELQLSREQFQESIRQWEAQYQLSIRQFLKDQELSYAQLTGTLYDGTPTMSMQQLHKSQELDYAKLTGTLYDGTPTLSMQQLRNSQELDYAKLLGYLSDGTPTLAATQHQQEQLSKMGYALLESGIQPGTDQLAAMGMTEQQAQAYLKAQQKAAAPKSSGSSGSTRKTSINGAKDVYQLLQKAGYSVWSDERQVKAYLTGLGITNAATYTDGFFSWAAEQPITSLDQLGETARSVAGLMTDDFYPDSVKQNEVERKLDQMEITEAEADYLRSIIKQGGILNKQ